MASLKESYEDSKSTPMNNNPYPKVLLITFESTVERDRSFLLLDDCTYAQIAFWRHSDEFTLLSARTLSNWLMT